MYRPVPSYTDTSHFRAPWENVVLSGVGQVDPSWVGFNPQPDPPKGLTWRDAGARGVAPVIAHTAARGVPPGVMPAARFGWSKYGFNPQPDPPKAGYGEVPAYTDIAHFRAPFKASMMSLGQDERILGMQPMTYYLVMGSVVVGLILFAD